ncbi:MAG: proline--tRNA ligase, partial [Anaeroplasmataceae bacterium]|nr:proline--tRNA ligase [Anaeroplasmataceae bacterium]
MKASRMLISTLKEAPQEAKIDSHILLLRAGMIKAQVAGVYQFLPLGLRVLHKIEDVIRQEMDATGAMEILCSALQPKELWEESGRWSKYGPELMRLTDRHEREFCLGPTHEEVFTTLVRDLVKSSKSLPLNIYQIQTKYRDERRPRFGLMRGREFLMKDAYSFDKDEEGLDKSYQIMYDAYSKIFSRLGLHYQVVLADTGNIGGNGSHQFMALSEVGESEIVYCDACGYAADVEKATAKPIEIPKEEALPLEKVYTPNQRTIEEISAFLGIDATKTVKTLIYHDYVNEKLVAVVVRGDREVNEIKLINALNSNENYLELASDEEITSLGSIHGFVGPKGLSCEVYVDEEVTRLSNFVIGANEKDYHLKNVNYGIDFEGIVCDLRKNIAGDLCPICGKPMGLERGIEVGQIFKLQTKYSTPMNCTYVNEVGKNVPMVMGCYGIGVSRTLQSIVEQYHDEYGIKWPLNVAPYHVVIVPISYQDIEQQALSIKAYEALAGKAEVILDDRNAKPGFKFKDWELIGIPYMIICGKRSNEGIVEFKNRTTLEKEEIAIEEAINRIIKLV